jgi:hypothetical protein
MILIQHNKEESMPIRLKKVRALGYDPLKIAA